MRQTAAMGVAGRVAARVLVIVAALIAALVFSTVANLTASARAAEPASTTLKAVVIVGPTHEQTAEYLTLGENIAKAAENNGMQVARIFHPNATWSRVVAETTGANFVAYLGHGNGWPSPYAPFQENTKNGFGLNFPDASKRGTGDVKYYGADKIRESLHLAENSIVLLNKACYASGHGEQWMETPTQSVAVQRVDNFAAGFLAVGARVVMGLTYQKGETIVNSLFSQHTTIEGVFRMRFNPWNNGVIWPGYGWVGWNPTYHDSVRTPGARILIDPDPEDSYRRALTGDLTMTTDEWRGSADPSDVVPPVVTDLAGVPSADVILASEDAPPAFTPNGDGLSDSLDVRHTLSEGAYLDFQIRNADGNLVRSFMTWADGGSASTNWNGRNDGGQVVQDGRYDITVTPRDVAGNVGDPATTRVKVLTTMKAPGASPAHFFSRDNDALAQTTTLSVTITRDAVLDWTIVDAQDNVVATLASGQAVSAGLLSHTWDGRDGSGNALPDGMYYQVMRATTDNGSYSHRLPLRLMFLKVTAPTWTAPAGTKVTFTMVSAEPISGWPRVTVFQPGLAKYTVSTTKYSTKKYKFNVTFKSGGTAGQVKIRIVSTDSGGGKQTQDVFFTLQ